MKIDRAIGYGTARGFVVSIAPALFLLGNTVTVVSMLWVVLVAFDVLGTVWLVVGPAMVGAAEIVASHWRYGRGQPAEAGEDSPSPSRRPTDRAARRRIACASDSGGPGAQPARALPLHGLA